ncbi:MAG TPA: hypothetical protein VHK01_02885 [Lacipirellulaceae bacterium]|nr:hypothetical protein [Lacipirellulaceae bacterium]
MTSFTAVTLVGRFVDIAELWQLNLCAIKIPSECEIDAVKAGHYKQFQNSLSFGGKAGKGLLCTASLSFETASHHPRYD